MHTGRPPRLRTFDYLGFHRYSLTFCTDWRRKWFVKHPAVNLVLSQFLRTAINKEFAIIVYCFMPDHVHLLIEGLTPASDGKEFIVRAKQCSAHAFADQFNVRLWQPSGFEHVVRDDEKTQIIARYILENPVRAGLVRSPLDYPFSGSQVYKLEELLEGLY